MTDLELAVSATLRDMIDNSTQCGCCDSDTMHADLIRRALARFPPALWPLASQMPVWFKKNTLYAPIRQAIVERKVFWR